MKRLLSVIALLMPVINAEAIAYYGKELCNYPPYHCLKVGRGQSWETLFPDKKQRDIVQRLNRTYNKLWVGKTLVVPQILVNKTLLDFAPFEQTIIPDGETQVIVDQDKLAWGAYDIQGHLVNWGPISSGRDKCSDSSQSCRTMTGIFYFFSKENEKCRSNVFPIGKGGAKMPYCMYYHKGFALHGSDNIPGYRASHGCIRLFTRDAYWLNHQFVVTASSDNNFIGTKIIVRPITSNLSEVAQ
jgi:hypothetical protein